ncbi:hypothetical protein AKJ52_01910 [candidate division MSBL1 archaeon SCGC-AAA382C18]|uniref:Uncharacterized protein n=1 Tax=candidate division MSBL1 archaeon SCGC-AAA382C18 TaxID=1698281 RepID=A0A133VJL6_9EURY|nr:hypothetical protein AKJ52_01910 [candidate division MSBL1 archaeon SCGC-AAA382C18]
MKIRVTKTFQYEGKEYEEGQKVDLPDSVGRSVLEKGFGKKIEEETPTIESIEEPEEERKKPPEWKRKIWISEDRNLSVSIWPPGGKFNSPSVTLEENRRDDSGNWESDRIYLPTGSALLALSAHLQSAWEEIQEIKTGEKN